MAASGALLALGLIGLVLALCCRSSADCRRHHRQQEKARPTARGLEGLHRGNRATAADAADCTWLMASVGRFHSYSQQQHWRRGQRRTHKLESPLLHRRPWSATTDHATRRLAAVVGVDELGIPARHAGQHNNKQNSRVAMQGGDFGELSIRTTPAVATESAGGENRGQAGKYRRQALDLAVNRLHILESLDEQLREFAASAEQSPSGSSSSSGSSASSGGGKRTRANGQQLWWSQEVCVLELDFSKRRTSLGSVGSPANSRGGPTASAGAAASPFAGERNCLANAHLKRHVPPYMLNLHRQLLSESRTFADAVRLMPYQSLVMRSFRQPALVALDRANSSSSERNGGRHKKGEGEEDDEGEGEDASEEATGADYAGSGGDDDDDGHKGEVGEPSIVVELSALGPAPASPAAENETQSVQTELEELGGGHNGLEAAEFEQPTEGGLTNKDKGSGSVFQLEKPTSAACDVSQRALPAHERSELCYWFQLGEQLRLKINGSLVRSVRSSAWKRERLVEAELHVFKLPPDTLASGEPNEENSVEFEAASSPATSSVTSASRWSVRQQQQPQRQPSGERSEQQRGHWRQARANHSRSSWHLKTNLLEVSLYQILPKKNSSYAAKLAASFSHSAEFPLRLLDIRRIDLHSSGWETFYVKRAVEDWLRDASLNLGLVIKAKSMFGEPVRIGLIRFADLYDHRQQQQQQQQKQKEKQHYKRQTTADEQAMTRRTSERPAGQRASAQPKTKRPSSSERTTTTAADFDLDHQPILVIYTAAAAATTETENESALNSSVA